MLTFEYTAKDGRSGEIIKAEVQASSESVASKMLAEQGLAPLELKLKNTNDSIFSFIKNRVSAKEKVLFSRQLSTLINAGLPLTQSLRTVTDQVDNAHFAHIINQVITDVEGGTSFANALSKYPKIFNEVFVSLVSAGEASGTLDKALERIASQQEKDAEMLSKVRGALFYPAIVLFVIVGVVVFMLTTVLPQVELLYKDLNQSLPFVTEIMLKISRLIINFWYVIILALFGLVFLLRRYVKTSNGRQVFDNLKMNIPLFGKLFNKVYMARFCHSGSTLMSSGVPMLEMMRITGEAVGNVHVKSAIMRASEKVKGGVALSDSLKGEQTFLPLVPQMINIGEQSGAIDGMMAKAADYYENEIDNEIKTISTTIEPLLMIVLGGIAAVMVAAILIPVYGLVGKNISL